ncbi:hypothetical protein AB0D62_34420 [Streptomyces massasporeus]|uniref:hypothetical protein n=1 Tax=Streptomyces massasporeus TaxID=67324 RepID=UPI0034047737
MDTAEPSLSLLRGDNELHRAQRAECAVSVRDDPIIKELAHYIHEHPAEQMALMPVYAAARDHAQRRSCTHGGRCPHVMTGAVVVDENDRVLCLRDETGCALAETEPEDQDDSLSAAASRLLAEEVGSATYGRSPASRAPSWST